VVVWLTALGLVVAGLAPLPDDAVGVWRRARGWIGRDVWGLGVDRTTALVVGTVVLAALVRARYLARVPAEMASLHAELLLSIQMVSPTGGPIVFPFGVGGTEPVPIYLTAVLAPLTGGLGFACLKLGALLSGLATVAFIYLLGRDLAGRSAGLAGAALAAVGLWPDLVSRVGLEGSWYPSFAAAALWLLVRAIGSGRRRDFVAAGAVIGLAIQTVSMARSLLVASVFLVGLGWWSADRDRRRRLVAGLGVVIVVALVAGLPTIAASASAHDVGAGWWLGAADGARDGSAIVGLGDRLLRCVLSPLWSDGPLWIHGGGNRPALDRVAAALLVVGAALTALAALRRRALGARLLLISVPLLMLPAALSTLEPSAAPSPLRCGGAMAPIFVLAGIGLAALSSAASATLAAPAGRRLGGVVTVLAVVLSASAGRAVVHGSFAETWDRSAWNASELGEVVRAAAILGVPVERAWVVPFPYWVDTRLVAFEAKLPGRDLALDPTRVAETAGRAGPKLFLVHPEDHRTLRALADKIPAAVTIPMTSRVGGKNFLAVVDLSMSGGG
jgi:4-amino-4-deoxy-L-arabinose transferase-like glycosyltransferase